METVTTLEPSIEGIEAAAQAGESVLVEPGILLRMLACHWHTHTLKPIARVDDAKYRARLASVMMEQCDGADDTPWTRALQREAMELLQASARVESRDQPMRCADAAGLAMKLGRPVLALTLAATGLSVCVPADSAARDVLMGRLMTAGGQASIGGQIAAIIGEVMSNTLEWSDVPGRVDLSVSALDESEAPWSVEDTEAGVEDTDDAEEEAEAEESETDAADDID